MLKNIVAKIAFVLATFCLASPALATTPYLHAVNDVVNGNTVIALPSGSGNQGAKYELQRPDSTTFYDYLTNGQEQAEDFNLVIDGQNLNDTWPLPVKIMSSPGGTTPISAASPIPVVASTTIPVSGTFWQSTQPVSLATTVPVSIATTVPVSGTFWQSTQPVSLSSLPALPSGTNTIGTVNNVFTGTQVSGNITSGSGASSYVSVSNMSGYSAFTYSISGTYNITGTWEYSDDGITWTALYDSTGNTAVALTNTTRTAQVNSFGHLMVRVRASVYTSGTAAVTITPELNTGAVQLLDQSGLLLNSNSPGDSLGGVRGIGAVAYLQGWNGTNYDRVAVHNVGTDPGSASKGALTIQGSLSAIQVPVQVGGKTASVEVSPTISTSAYTANYVVGGKLTFSNAMLSAGTGILQSVYVRSKSVQTTGLKLYVFKTNPSNSTWTDHAAPSINASDLPYLVGVYPLSAADSTLGTETLWRVDGLGAALTPGATTLYGILICTGTPTFSSTSDITVGITVIQD